MWPTHSNNTSSKGDEGEGEEAEEGEGEEAAAFI